MGIQTGEWIEPVVSCRWVYHVVAKISKTDQSICDPHEM